MTTKDTGGLPKPFTGFEGPNYTQVPDALFDELLAYLSGTELKVLLYIMRRTFGFKRERDQISLSQMLHGIVKHDGERLDHGTGVSKPSLLRALRSLQEKGILIAERCRSTERGDEPTVYRLNVRESTPGKKMSLPVVKKVVQGGGQETLPGPWSRNVATQDTDSQETEEQETEKLEYSKIRKVTPGSRETETGSVPAARSSDRSRSTSGPSSPESIGSVLARRGQGRPRSQPRPETMEVDYQRIQALVEERAREFADTASLKSSTTRAWNLYRRSGLSIDAFTDRVYQAKALTQEATARITKTAEDPEYRVRRKSKMAYFFATLEDQLDLLTPEERARRETRSTSAPNPGSTPERNTRGRSPVEGEEEGQASTGRRRPDSEGPYADFIKS